LLQFSMEDYNRITLHEWIPFFLIFRLNLFMLSLNTLVLASTLPLGLESYFPVLVFTIHLCINSKYILSQFSCSGE